MSNSVIAVNPELMKQKAEEVEKTISNCKDILNKMQKKVNASSTYWTGAAADESRKAFERQRKNLEKRFDDLKKYPKELKQQSGIYQKTISKANELVDNINSLNMH